MESITFKVVKNSEVLLRLISMVLAILTALVIGLDAETKKLLFVQRRATVKDLQALWVATIIASVTAGYHLLQLFRCVFFAWTAKNPWKYNKFLAWICFALDQGATYAIFAGTLAGAQGSLVALLGVKALQWGKVCNIYTRFCVEIGSGVACGILASIAMAVVSSVSACRLFRLYPSNSHSSNRVARQPFF